MTNRVPCGIFINHRGPDTKHSIASTIYCTLNAVGLRPFLDAHTLLPGQYIPSGIQDAIRSASLHIAIFSPNYAQSFWCLEELVYMLRHTNTKIIPIFYHVKPADLRLIVNGKGVYAEAFSEHDRKGRFPWKKIEEWKWALYEASFISGHKVHDNWAEGRVLQSILDEALNGKRGTVIKMAKSLIRLDEYKSNLNLCEKKDLVMGAAIKCIGRVDLAIDVCADTVGRSLGKVDQFLDDPVRELDVCFNEVEMGLTSSFKWLMD